MSLLLLIVLGGLVVSSDVIRASEPELLEIVKRHDDMWKTIGSIQLSYTRSGSFGAINGVLPGCYCETDGNKIRVILVELGNFSTDKANRPVAVKMIRDIFYDGEKLHELKIPQDKYPLPKIRLCDYVFLRDEGYVGTITPRSFFDALIYFPIPRYFFVHTEKGGVTLLELVNKYPSRIVSSYRNESGDNIVEIAVDVGNHLDNRAELGPWKGIVRINTSKGYNIDSSWFSILTKDKPPVDLIAERSVKNYIKIGEHWIPEKIEFLLHNGEPEKISNRTSGVINDCKINDSSESRLDDFRFPTNFVVHEQLPGDQPTVTHIWGAENKPVRSFDIILEFIEYYSNECMTGELSQENKYLALRISLVVLGLIMIAVALYRLYAKER